MRATEDRPLGPGGVLAYQELLRENERLTRERDDALRRLAEYEAQLPFPATEVARG